MEKYSIAYQEFRRIWHDFIHTPRFKSTFIWGIALYLIALFALLRGDIYFLDDWGSASRETSWSHFSRYLATFILNDLSTLGKGSLDISPLLQILAVIFVVASSMILLYLIRKKFDLLGIIASLPLGLSPYFLENLSYKFESLTMSIALFFAVLPFLFQMQRRIFSAVSVVCLILMFMSYQAANAVYIILSLFFAFFMQADLRQGARFLARCACNLIIASLIYKFAIAEPVSEWTIHYTSDKMIALNALFVGISQNLAQYLASIFNDLKSTPFIYLIALNFALFVGNMAIFSQRRIYALCGAIAFLMLGIALSYGLYLVLEKPILNPRVFYGFNAFVAIICIANITKFNVFCHSKHCEESKTNPFVILSEAKYLKNIQNRDSSPTAQNDNVGRVSSLTQNDNLNRRIYNQNPPPQQQFTKIPPDSANFIHCKHYNYRIFSY